MPVDTSQIGKPTSAVRSRVELGPVDFFARAVCDENPVYHDPEAAKAAGFNNVVAPPTFTFALNHMGRAGETQPPDPTGGPVDFDRMARARELSEQHRCNFCHQGNYSGAENVPRLAGQREEYVVKALREYKNNTRRGYDASMADVLYLISDEQIQDLAYFLARLR